MFSNTLKTTFLLALMTVLIILIGRAFGGQQGMVMAFILAGVMNLGSYWFSDRIVLAMYRAQEISPQEHPGIHQIVAELAQNAGIPKPRVYLIEDDSPNAFATGRNPQHAVVAVTTGVMRILSREELRGVLAHELGHVKNRDILIGSIAATMAGAIMMIANMARFAAIFGGGRSSNEEGGGGGGIIGMLVLTIVAPIAAMLIQMAISRSREYLADASGAQFSHNPLSLASALEKLQRASQQIPLADAKPATAHMFIVNPLSGRSLMNLFSTHPPIEERIARLRGMRT
ncbi:MAG TPA: zinc metalloprotease HtpX [Thermodesulfobacteriota bacterium]|nr:zinc metalloprotease HtpX [Thermodesulfobacteriota bacterium]